MTFDLYADDALATAARAAIGFLAALVLLKLAKKRFMRGGTPLDTLLVVVGGSVLARGIVQGEHFWASLAGVVVLVLLHSLLAATAWFFPHLSDLIEGRTRRLVSDGVIDRREMRAALLKDDDLAEAVRVRLGVDDLSRVQDAWQEKSGEISVRLSEEKPGKPVRRAPVSGKVEG